jgi:hypothetical protein
MLFCRSQSAHREQKREVGILQLSASCVKEALMGYARLKVRDEMAITYEIAIAPENLKPRKVRSYGKRGTAGVPDMTETSSCFKQTTYYNASPTNPDPGRDHTLAFSISDKGRYLDKGKMKYKYTGVKPLYSRPSIQLNRIPQRLNAQCRNRGFGFQCLRSIFTL